MTESAIASMILAFGALAASAGSLYGIAHGWPDRASGGLFVISILLLAIAVVVMWDDEEVED